MARDFNRLENAWRVDISMARFMVVHGGMHGPIMVGHVAERGPLDGRDGATAGRGAGFWRG
jgi:hypothetical protein